MRKALLFFFGWFLLGPSAAFAVLAHPDQVWVYTDALGAQIPFRFGIDTAKGYNLTFPFSVTTPQQNEVLALSQFNNYGYSGVNPTVTQGNLFPIGTVGNWITAVVPENANFAVTAADLGKLFIVTTGTATITVTVPTPASVGAGFYFFVEKFDGPVFTTPTGNIVFTGPGAFPVADISAQGQIGGFVSDAGTNWFSFYWTNLVSQTGDVTTTAHETISLQPQNTFALGDNATPTIYLGPPHPNGPPVADQFLSGGYTITTTDGSGGVDQNPSCLVLQTGPGTGAAFSYGVQINTWLRDVSGSALQSTVLPAIQVQPLGTTISAPNGPLLFIAQDQPSGVEDFNFADGTNPGYSRLIGTRQDGTIETRGTDRNDNPQAGSVGEYVTSNIAAGSAVSLSTGAVSNITQLALSGGDWDVWGIVIFQQGAGTTATVYAAAISPTTGSIGTVGANAAQLAGQITASGVDGALTPPQQREQIALGGSTVFLTAEATFAVSTMKAYGFISARRRR